MALSDIVNLSIVESSQAVSRPGFGTALIFAPTPYTSNLVRQYSSQAAMISDGFTTSDLAYLAAGAVFGQTPHSAVVKVGKCTALPTTSLSITAAVANNTTYSFLLCTQAAPAGTLISYTSGGSATLSAINAGLLAVVNGLAVGIVATDQTTYLRLQGSVAGTYFGVASPSSNLTILDQSADNGFAAQLAAIQQEDPNWYGLASVFNSAAQIQVLSTFAEGNRKLLFAQTQDTNVVSAGSSDIASSLQTATRTHTTLLHVANPMQFGNAAWVGRVFAENPGSETWKFKSLAGVSVEALSDTQQAFAVAKSANCYVTLNSINFTREGTVSSGEFIDIIRFIDWLYSNLQLDIFALLASAVKIPYTDAGAAVLESTIRARLQQGVQVGGLVAGSIVINVPLVSTQLAGDRAKRYFPGVTFFANLQGAIHSVAISGTVSV